MFFGGVMYEQSCQGKGALTWIEFVNNIESGENSSGKLKPPSSLCNQDFFPFGDHIWAACHKGS